MEKDVILNKMRRICSLKEYCKSDIQKKVMALSDSDVLCEEIITTLCEEKFLDEIRYTKAYIRDKVLLDGWGERKIIYQLRSKGIDNQCIIEALNSISFDEIIGKLEVILGNKYKSLKGTEEEKFAKIYRFAVGKGFTYDQIKIAYDNIRTNKRS